MSKFTTEMIELDYRLPTPIRLRKRLALQASIIAILLSQASLVCGQVDDVPSSHYLIQIVSPSGDPLDGTIAQILLHHRTGSSGRATPEALDANGYLKIPQAKANAFDLVIIMVRDEDRGLGGVFAIDEGLKKQLKEKEPYVFKSQPLVNLRGRIVDVDTDSPMAGVSVQLKARIHPNLATLSTEIPAATSAANGDFAIANVIEGMTGFLVASHDDIIESNLLGDEIKVIGSDDVHQVTVARKAVTEDSRIKPIVVPDTSDLDPIEAIELLTQEFKAASDEFMEALQSAPDTATRLLITQRRLPNRLYLEAALKIADAHPNTEVERKALLFCVKVPMMTDEPNLPERYDLRTKVGSRIAVSYLSSPDVEGSLTELIYSQADPLSLVSRLVNENPSRNVKGKSLLIKAEYLMRKADLARRMNSVRNGVNAQDTKEVHQLESSAAEALEKVMREFGDVPYWRKGTIGETARGYMSELLTLNVGQEAPNIKAVNLDGEEMELTQFRGKIVILDFWGSWCAPCIGDLPKLNAVSDRFPEDLVVLGVMNDSPDDARAAIAKHNVTWKNWVEAKDGPIMTRYNINSWPTTFIIDREGIIRYTDFAKIIGAENYRVRVESLLAEENSERKKE